jgi:hypothetical protein
MANIGEIDNPSPIKQVIEEGLEVLSGGQEIVFQKYTRAVLPLDGYVFFVRDTATPSMSVAGSLHYDTDQQQRADETIGINKVVFTTQNEVQDFNTISVNSVWIGAIDGIRFAFTARGRKYQQAGTYHYRGDAIYPAMYTQIIDNPGTPVSLGNLIATNSMPIWLALNQYMTLYPAFLVQSNIHPPYASVEISDTKPLQSAPMIDSLSGSHQLMTEKVKIVMNGLRNNDAIDFLNYVFQYTLDTESFGIQNMPGIVDEKRGQSELGILAQKKTIEFEVNYYQTRVQAVARQLILNAGFTLSIA